MQNIKIGEFILVLNSWDIRAIGTVAKVLEYCYVIDDPCPYRVEIEGTIAHTWADGIRATELLKALV
jgi:hypothetical protein